MTYKAVILIAVVGLGLCAGVAEAGSPTVRHITTAIWNSPERLPALPEVPSIHYEPGARDQARRVAAILPAAVRRVEMVQGRPFARPVIIGVYASPAAFAVANGVGTADVGGVTFMGRITLSPALFTRRPDRLEPVLTHELSHAHLAGWMGVFATIRLPNWFKEGLAVLVSRGGGAEGVTDVEAREAICRGDRIAINEAGSLMHLSAVDFEHAPTGPRLPGRVEMAYRQAALFVRYLRDADPDAFARMMHDIEDKRPLKDAVPASYGATIAVLWSHFVAGCGAMSVHRRTALRRGTHEPRSWPDFSWAYLSPRRHHRSWLDSPPARARLACVTRTSPSRNARHARRPAGALANVGHPERSAEGA